MYALRCMHYVFAAGNPSFTVFYGQILVWFGSSFIPQGTIELILRDDFEPVRYVTLLKREKSENSQKLAVKLQTNHTSKN